MRYTILVILVLFSLNCFSQKSFTYSIAPNWGISVSQMTKSQPFKIDSVYFYKKKKNNKDSTLIMMQYFDSVGYLVERDEFSFSGEVFRVSNFTYIDTILSMQEVISKDRFFVNGSNLSKEVKMYDYDSAGNAITEEEHSFFGDSLKSLSVTVCKREYDNKGHLVREFVTLPKAKTYLYHTYYYANGLLSEIKTYDINGNFMYSYLYEVNNAANAKTVFLSNYEKKISHEYFYDKEKRLIQEKDYEQGHGILDHITQGYVYNLNGLLESQSVQDLKGNNYYYKHFYSK